MAAVKVRRYATGIRGPIRSRSTLLRWIGGILRVAVEGDCDLEFSYPLGEDGLGGEGEHRAKTDVR